MNGNKNVTAVKEIRHRGGAITSPRWRISVTAVTINCHRGDGNWRLCVAGKTHYKNIPVSRSFLSHANLAKNAKFSCIIDFGLTQISQISRRQVASPLLSVLHTECTRRMVAASFLRCSFCEIREICVRHIHRN